MHEQSQAFSEKNNAATEEAALEAPASQSSKKSQVYNRNFMTSLKSNTRNELK